ncbi:MAG: sphingosine N-acyltransferase lag1 [Chrysothrix sp. TS-e1954]|nr:MAG: sphingosine N-acyltransferase lag1 [Chrysothrix sp. TS-e1954]
MSYGYYHTNVGNVILCIMDQVDLVLSTAKMLKYAGYQTACDVAFGIFILSWFATRHVCYLTICWSIWVDVPEKIPYGCYSSLSGVYIAPQEAQDVASRQRGKGNEVLSNLLHAFVEPEAPVCFNKSIHYTFLGLLLFLQGLTIMWFVLILRIAWRVVKGDGADDTRSDDEEEVEGEEAIILATEKEARISMQPVEEFVGVEALNLKRRASPLFRNRKAPSHTGEQTKQQLLSYVAYYGPDDGMTLSGLKALFHSRHSDHTSGEDITRLDLGGSLGRGLSLKGLQTFWMNNGKNKKRPDIGPDTVPEAWDEDPSFNKLTITSALTTFPQISHLSLSKPAHNVSWLDLLNFSRHLGSISHLSLEDWPCPLLPQHTEADTPHKAQKAGVSHQDEAAHILRLLSNNTPELKWLSLAGCQSWWHALLPRSYWQSEVGANFQDLLRPNLWATASRADPATRGLGPLRGRGRAPWLNTNDSEWVVAAQASESGSRPEWTRSWARLQHLVLAHGPIPSTLKPQQLSRLNDARGAVAKMSPETLKRLLRNPREPESYTVLEPEGALQGSVEQQLSRREWLNQQHQTYLLAGAINQGRKEVGRPTIQFEFGWGREELLEAHDSEAPAPAHAHAVILAADV